jgi:argininosuccinate lyase
MVRFQIFKFNLVTFFKKLILCIIILIFFSFEKSWSQDFKERNYHIKNRSLGEYYRQSVPDDAKPGVIYPQPWLLFTPWKNDLTERIDKIYAPSYATYYNTAWILMEIKTGMIPDTMHVEMAKVILEFWENPDPKYYEIKGLQNLINEKLGSEYGGYVMLARTLKPEQQFTVRHNLTKIICLMHDFLQVLLETADRTKNSVMPGYTHLRHAQPTTLGHYLLSIYDPLYRCVEKLEQSYYDMSLTELGCGALAGTSWPIDRDMVSAYMANEGLIENTNDAVSRSDGYVDLTANIANISAIISRLGENLYYWSTLEFDFLDFEIGAGSFMMPNKRSNQSFFEHTYIQSAKIVGYLTECATMGIRIHHGDMNALEFHMQNAPLNAMNALDANIVKPLLYHLPGMHVFEENMLETARIGYSCATELSNYITHRFGIDYRTSHDLVNLFVKESSIKRIPSKEADINIFHKVSKEFLGKTLDITEKELRLSLDPVNFITVTNSRGAVAPDEVSRMIDSRWSELDVLRDRHMARIEKQESAKKRMLGDLRKISDPITN